MSEERKTFCTECGTENSAGSKFCSNCGNRLEQAAPAENATMVETPVMDALAADAKEEITYAEETTPYTAEVPFENTGYAAEETIAAPKAVREEEIAINYSQDAGSFSGNAYEAQPQYYSTEPVTEKKKNQGVAIASMVCGILSVICCCFSCFSLVLAIAAVVLGIITLACKYDGKGMAIAGIVLGGIGLLLFVAVIAIGASDGYTEMMDEIMNELY